DERPEFPSELTMHSAKRPPSAQEMLAFRCGELSIKHIALAARFKVTFNLVAQCVEHSRHAYDHRYPVLLDCIDDLRRIQRVLKEYFTCEQLWNGYSHELTEHVTQRDQV